MSASFGGAAQNPDTSITNTSPSGQPTYYLPNEIWVHAFRYLRPKVDPSLSYSSKDLLAIICVCRRFHKIAVPFLYENLMLNSRTKADEASANDWFSKRQVALVPTLDLHPEYATLVRNLQVQLDCRQNTDDMLSATRLMRLTAPYLSEFGVTMTIFHGIDERKFDPASRLITLALNSMSSLTRTTLTVRSGYDGSQMRPHRGEATTRMSKLSLCGGWHEMEEALRYVLRAATWRSLSDIQHLEYETDGAECGKLDLEAAGLTSLNYLHLRMREKQPLRSNHNSYRQSVVQRIVITHRRSLEVLSLEGLPTYCSFNAPNMDMQSLSRLRTLQVGILEFFAKEPRNVWSQWLVPTLEILELRAEVDQDLETQLRNWPAYGILFDLVHGQRLVDCVELATAHANLHGGMRRLSLQKIVYLSTFSLGTIDPRIPSPGNRGLFIATRHDQRALQMTAPKLAGLDVHLQWALPT